MLVYIKPLSMFPKLHSDTLFGALTSAISELYPDKVDELLKEFENNNPQFLITSAFPFIWVGDDKIRFFPKIIDDSKDEVILDSKNIKEFKKVEYLEESIFFDMIDGKLSESDIINNFEDYSKVGNLLMSNDPNVSIRANENVVPNNSVNRLTNETDAIFYSYGMNYENMGLYFYIDVINPIYEKIISSALRFLKDRGFGKDISTGKGQFDYEIADENLRSRSGNKFLTLSRFVPTKDDLDEIVPNSSYEIVSKRGRDKSGEIRKQVRFFKEGSTFSDSKKFYGQIIKSGDVNPAIEYGFAFAVRYGGDKDE